MSFRLLNISSVYPGYLKAFYSKHPEADVLPYHDLNDLMIGETTEFAGSYTRTFRKLGIDAQCIIANDPGMQGKWRQENNSAGKGNLTVLMSQVKEFNPDVLWIENIGGVDRSWIRSVRESVKSIKLIAGYHCAPFNPAMLQTLSSVDMVFTCTPGLVDILKSGGINSHLVYHGFDASILDRLIGFPGKDSNQLLFSGSLFTGGELHNSRIRLIESIISQNIDLALYANLESRFKIKLKQSAGAVSNLLYNMNLGKLSDRLPVSGIRGEKVLDYSPALRSICKPPLYGIEMYNLLRNSGIVLNIHLGMAANYAGNMRMFEVTGVGSCLLTDNKKNIGDLFVPGKEVIVYDSADDCIEKIKWLRDHDDYRSEIAQNGQKRTLEFHSVRDRCKQISSILNNSLHCQ